jgi:sugar diacid utilization regulator
MGLVMSERATALVRDWGLRFKPDPLVERILVEVRERATELQLSALDGLQRENAAFQRANTEQFRSEALGHCKELSNTMLAIASGRGEALGSDPFSFVRLHAARRARQRFPLAGSLNAYRLAHKNYWTLMREQIVALARDDEQVSLCSMLLSEFLIEFFDLISGILTDAYLATEQRLAEQRLRARAALVEDLLNGRPPGDLEARELSESHGFRDGVPIAVAVVCLDQPQSGQAQRSALIRLSGVVEEVLSASDFSALVETRNDAVVAIATGAAGFARGIVDVLRSGVTRRRDRFPFSIEAGVSLEVTELAAVPQAYREAERAAEFADHRRPVVHFADIDLVELLLRRPDATALRLIPEWAVRLRDADSKKSGDLLRTVRAFADSDLNVKRTARQLQLHTNTVYFRLNRIKKLTGVDPRSFSGASLLLTAMRMLDVKPGEGKARQ